MIFGWLLVYLLVVFVEVLVLGDCLTLARFWLVVVCWFEFWDFLFCCLFMLVLFTLVGFLV